MDDVNACNLEHNDQESNAQMDVENSEKSNHDGQSSNSMEMLPNQGSDKLECQEKDPFKSLASSDAIASKLNSPNEDNTELSSKSHNNQDPPPLSSSEIIGPVIPTSNEEDKTSTPSASVQHCSENEMSLDNIDNDSNKHRTDDTNKTVSVHNSDIEMNEDVQAQTDKNTENESNTIKSSDKESENASNINGESIEVVETCEMSEDKEKKSSDEAENKEKTTEEGNMSLKIQMVTSLGSSDTDTFVEPPTGPVSPAQAMSNPLDSDRDETNDSVRSDVSVTKDSQSAEKNVSPAEGVQIKMIDGTDKTDVDKDNDQVEVITGDKTISRECVQKMKTGIFPRNLVDQGYLRKSNGSLQSDNSKKTNFGVKVIYPKKKNYDINQVKITKIPIPLLKSCLQCSKVSNCNIQVDISGSECYLCSEECLKQHRTVQNRALQRKNSSTVPTDDQDVGSESRLCVNCDANVSILPEEKILSWETMEFCNEDCLGKYQVKMWSFCSACKKDVPTSSMGKYCVRFGHEVKQFCSASCLEEYKKGIKACSYCQKDLSDGEGFLAPIGEKGNFKDFCSQLCLDDYDSMSRCLPPLLKVEPCGVCDKTALVQLQVITPNNCVNLCSEVCFAAFKFVNKSISSTPCFLCKKYYEKTLPTCITIYYENDLLSFCSKSCMNINILAKRKIVSCSWCKVKKYNFDMIRRKSSSGTPTNWCSVNCMALYQVSVNAINHRSKMNCTQCNKLDVPNLHLTMSDATVRNFCSMECVNKFQTSFSSQGIPSNGVFPTGTPKRVVRTRALQPSQSPDGSSPKNENTSLSTPQTSSGITTIPLKKPEIKVITPVNGPSPSSSAPISPSVQSTGSQNIRYQILVMPPQPPEVMNAQVQVKPHMISKSVSVKSNIITKSIQTDNDQEEVLKGPVIVPVPVPIYIPCPMAMYSVPVPTPFPLPIPVPVPVFIPTTKGSAEEILADIKRIQEQIPGNPIEAELIMMAEMAEGEKSREADVEGSSSDTAEERRVGQKRPVSSCDGLDDNEKPGPPEKKRRDGDSSCGVGETIEGAIVHELATSRLNLSLKETLGVSAWRTYAAEVGERKNLLEMRPGELAQALKGFILNAKMPGRLDYTPDQKYYLMLGIQYYLEENGRLDNIFFDKLFDPFIDALNEEAKKFQNMFSQCENIITRVEEEHLWESKQLGPHSPAILLATLIYFNTKYFNLTTVEEHMQLSFSHIMKHWKRNPNASPGNNTSNGSRNILLRFYPPQSVLDGNAQKKKVYEQEANDDDPYRCPIHLYDFYISKCPEVVKTKNDLFYMSPERSCVPDSPIWYSTLPLSQDVIERTLNRFKMVKEINLALL